LPRAAQAIPLLKESIKKAYGKKGEKVVQQNWDAVDGALDKLVKIEIPEGWRQDDVRVGGALGTSRSGAARAWQQQALQCSVGGRGSGSLQDCRLS
jgi:hypothetical protein